MHPWCKFERTIEVEIMRLDDWADSKKIREIDIIKADVQGAERDLIEGGLSSLRKTRYFYTEYNDSEAYEGQPTLEEILSMLPFFSINSKFDNDVLLENRLLRGAEMQLKAHLQRLVI